MLHRVIVSLESVIFFLGPHILSSVLGHCHSLTSKFFFLDSYHFLRFFISGLFHSVLLFTFFTPRGVHGHGAGGGRLNESSLSCGSHGSCG